jgi:formate hydrogenlyase subunit 3/multisubunit Na+/H+ antiporter MnhD subunit
MISWVARGLLIAAGFVASWFVTSDVPRFGLVQAAVVLVLLVSIVAVLAFWPAKWFDSDQPDRKKAKY